MTQVGARDPFMHSYAPFTGARTPDLWCHLWLAPSSTAVVDYTGLVGGQSDESDPLVLHGVPPLHADARMMIAESVVVCPAGPSLLHRNAGRQAVGVYSTRTHQVVEISPGLYDALVCGTDLRAIRSSWGEHDHPMPGSSDSLLRTMLAGAMLGDAAPRRVGDTEHVTVRRSGAVFVASAHDEGSTRAYCFATGDRIVLSPGAAQLWADLEGAHATVSELLQEPLMRRLLRGAFVHLEVKE